MRIAYVTLHLEKKIIEGGVGKKIKSQISNWRKAGHQVRLFSLTPEKVSLLEAEEFLFQPSVRFFGGSLLSREVNRSKMLARLILAVREYRPDIIYLRYGLFAYPLQRLFRVAPVVVEVNTNDRFEYRYRGAFYYWLNCMTRRITLGLAAGWVSISHEIAQLKCNAFYSKPVEVIANGIELENYPLLDPPGNHTPVIAIVGTPGLNWHGVDKLVGLAEQFPDLKAAIVGYRSQDYKSSAPPNVSFHGFLDQAGIMEVLSRADIACGTLALHRKNMQEASPLKVREALAYGLPVILAYKDTDLSGLSSDLLLRLPNTDGNVSEHAREIHDFAYQARGKRIQRELLFPLIDERQKEERRLSFFQRIIAQQVE
ncbi:MAG: glycosyltransferase family 4 protein [Anaerolineales bacterium]|nr:glycosyltransferase family 4 protein [Anaerolineales bacterium]